MGSFFEMVENILRDESRRDDTLLNEFRVNYTRKDSDGKKQQDSFRIQESGYHYYIKNLKVLPSGRRKPGRLVKMIPDGKFTVCESVGVELGKVTKNFCLKEFS